MRTDSPRRWLGVLHLWLGLALCLPFAMLGLTGTLLVFERPLESLGQSRDHRAEGGPAQPVSAIIEAARKVAPEGQAPTLYVPSGEAGAPAAVRFAPASRGVGPGFGAQIKVDPVSLAVVDPGQGANGFMRIVHRLHGNLLMNGRTGRSIIGWLGVAMLAMGLSGLWIWWPRPGRWVAALRVSPTARGLRLYRELHGAVGFWGLAVFTIVSIAHAGSAEGAPAIAVFVDPWAARIVEVRDPGAAKAGPRLIAWQHAIHSGAGLGPLWRTLAGLCGLLPVLFAFTGISMWLMKRRARRSVFLKKTATPEAAE